MLCLDARDYFTTTNLEIHISVPHYVIVACLAIRQVS